MTLIPGNITVYFHTVLQCTAAAAAIRICTARISEAPQRAHQSPPSLGPLPLYHQQHLPQVPDLKSSKKKKKKVLPSFRIPVDHIVMSSRTGAVIKITNCRTVSYPYMHKGLINGRHGSRPTIWTSRQIFSIRIEWRNGTRYWVGFISEPERGVGHA